MIGQQLGNASDVALMYQAAASGARVTFALGILMTEIVATTRRVALKALRRFAETLGRRPVGFQLGHELISICVAKVRKADPFRTARLPAESPHLRASDSLLFW